LTAPVDRESKIVQFVPKATTDPKEHTKSLANADAEVKRAAHRVTDGNDGFAKAVERFVLPRA
jgi:hypothetical protein